MAFIDSLVSAYNMDSSGNLGLDSFGSNSMTNNNSVAAGTGQIAGDAVFDGTNKFLSVADNASLHFRNGDLTLTFWVKFASLTGSPGIVSKWNSSFDWTAYLDSANSNKLTFWISNDGTDFGDTVKAAWSGSATTGVWYFVECQWVNGDGKCYINVNNGTRVGSAGTLGIHNGTAAMEIGRMNGNAQHLNGEVDSVDLWKRQLVSGERTQLVAGTTLSQYPWANNRRRVSSYLIR